MLSDGWISRRVDRWDQGLYLLEDIIDHFVDLLSRHRFSILRSLDDVRAERLDVKGQRMLKSGFCKARAHEGMKRPYNINRIAVFVGIGQFDGAGE